MDGGLANNDPSTVGLSMLLLNNPFDAITKTAILSIGCGEVQRNNYNSWFTVDLLPAVVKLAIGANGEDKSNFLRLIYRE